MWERHRASELARTGSAPRGQSRRPRAAWRPRSAAPSLLPWRAPGPIRSGLRGCRAAMRIPKSVAPPGEKPSVPCATSGHARERAARGARRWLLAGPWGGARLPRHWLTQRDTRRGAAGQGHLAQAWLHRLEGTTQSTRAERVAVLTQWQDSLTEFRDRPGGQDVPRNGPSRRRHA